MRRALVTGGSGDIGGAICRRLAADGMHVVVHGNSRPERAAAVVDEIAAAGGSAEYVVFDVSSAEAAAAALAQLLEDGPVQVLVNNAGSHQDAPLAGMSAPQWRDVVDTNLNGFFNVTQPLLLPMMATRWGRIVNVSSVAAVMGNRGQANYAAAKAGLHGATKSLAIELGSRGITVNAVAPGIIVGDMTATTFDEKTIKALVPMHRAGRPDEVASLIGFLVSENAAYISGQIISINGGMA